jgi:hypothetical protein
MFRELSEEINQVKDLYAQRQYFKVIFISIQLLEKMADEVDRIADSIAHEWENSALDSEDLKNLHRVREIYKKNLRKIKGDEAPRLKIQEVFMGIVSNTLFTRYEPEEVISMMHMVEHVVSFRNILAHEYFDKKSYIEERLSIRAKECLDIIFIFENHPLF